MADRLERVVNFEKSFSLTPEFLDAETEAPAALNSQKPVIFIALQLLLPEWRLFSVFHRYVLVLYNYDEGVFKTASDTY